MVKARFVGASLFAQRGVAQSILAGHYHFGTANGLVALLGGKYAVMTFIPFNAGDGLDVRRPSLDRAREMARHLHQRGIVAKLLLGEATR